MSPRRSHAPNSPPIPALAATFAAKLRDEPAFAASPAARLQFFARRHSSWDERFNLYPVLRTRDGCRESYLTAGCADAYTSVETSFTTDAVVAAAALRTTSASEMMPTTPPLSSTTGTRRILLVSITSQQSSSSYPG